MDYKFWRKIAHDTRGAVLAEAIVAVATLATAAIILGGIINSAQQATGTSRDYLVAQNLLTEGVEVVKNLRDSNLLKNPAHPECWLSLDPALNGDNGGCGFTATPGGDPDQINGTYYLPTLIEDDAGRHWGLVDIQDSLDLENDRENKFCLVLEDFGIGDNAGQIYVAIAEENTCRTAKFFRSVRFLTDDGNSSLIEVKVQWGSGKIHELKRNFLIYNRD
jgi:hypothetical protein